MEVLGDYVYVIYEKRPDFKGIRYIAKNKKIAKKLFNYFSSYYDEKNIHRTVDKEDYVRFTNGVEFRIDEVNLIKKIKE
jgi:hypothetical protein